jgi:hypothetical protein
MRPAARAVAERPHGAAARSVRISGSTASPRPGLNNWNPSMRLLRYRFGPGFCCGWCIGFCGGAIGGFWCGIWPGRFGGCEPGLFGGAPIVNLLEKVAVENGRIKVPIRCAA